MKSQWQFLVCLMLVLAVLSPIVKAESWEEDTAAENTSEDNTTEENTTNESTTKENTTKKDNTTNGSTRDEKKDTSDKDSSEEGPFDDYWSQEEAVINPGAVQTPVDYLDVADFTPAPSPWWWN
ncbi:hypothetical protein KR067_009627 [Drosophila pandora]|nr:hypothetical protein KR067_009627 [Drosophila pandora]